MAEEPQSAPARASQCLAELDGSDVREPGCYLHVASGLLTRIYEDDLGPGRVSARLRGGGRVVRLAGDPGAPLDLLRRIAARSPYRANF